MIPASEAKRHIDSGKRWTDVMAKDGFPILLAAAKDEGKITYQEFSVKLNELYGHAIPKTFRNYSKPAGKIGHALEILSKTWREPIPPLNVLMVNGTTGLPGDGAWSFVDRFVIAEQGKGTHDRESIFECVWDYHHWDMVATYFGVKIETRHFLKKPEPAIALPELPKGYGGTESPQHIALKGWVRVHPELFEEDFDKFPFGVNEQILRSADRLDVYFENAATCLAVEVKANNAAPDEYFRGIFQCVKYKAILRATQKAQGRYINAQAALVCERSLPSEARRLADRLSIPVYVVDRSTY